MPDASKMPARIWVDPYFSHQQVLPGTTRDVAYIRADIAERITKTLRALVDAKALSGVRNQVAGWNGEGRDEPHKERHPSRLGATLPKTNCGAVYELDDVMQAARAALSAWEASNGGGLAAEERE